MLARRSPMAPGGAEPQLLTVGEAGGEGFDDEEPAGLVAGADGGGLVEAAAGVEDVEASGWG